MYTIHNKTQNFITLFIRGEYINVAPNQLLVTHLVIPTIPIRKHIRKGLITVNNIQTIEANSIIYDILGFERVAGEKIKNASVSSFYFDTLKANPRFTGTNKHFSETILEGDNPIMGGSIDPEEGFFVTL